MESCIQFYERKIMTIYINNCPVTNRPTPTPEPTPLYIDNCICSNNLILNGNFEDVITEGSIGGGGAVRNWTIDNVDIHARKYHYPQTDLDRFIDLNAYVPGYIQQNFATNIGQAYKVSFNLSGNWWCGVYFGGQNTEKTLSVSIANNIFNFIINMSRYRLNYWPPINNDEMAWERKEFQFTAISTISTLRFESTSNVGDTRCGPIIDCVCVIPA